MLRLTTNVVENSSAATSPIPSARRNAVRPARGARRAATVAVPARPAAVSRGARMSIAGRARLPERARDAPQVGQRPRPDPLPCERADEQQQPERDARPDAVERRELGQVEREHLRGGEREERERAE